MDLVDEQQRALTGASGGAGFGEHFLQVGDARKDRGNGDEAHPHSIGEQSRDCRLAGAWRAPQDHRSELAGRDHAADRALGAGQMLLPDDLGERLWAQAVGERRVRRRRVRSAGRDFLVGEQVGHRSQS